MLLGIPPALKHGNKSKIPQQMALEWERHLYMRDVPLPSLITEGEFIMVSHVKQKSPQKILTQPGLIPSAAAGSVVKPVKPVKRAPCAES